MAWMTTSRGGWENVQALKNLKDLNDKKEEPTAEEIVGRCMPKITNLGESMKEKFKRMAKEYLEHFASSYPEAEQALNPEKPRRGAFNIR